VTQRILNAWYNSAWWLVLLRPIEWLFRGLRCWHLKVQSQPSSNPLPLVVVGNITLGGTGKTPVVVALVAALKTRGIRCGIISRGYGGGVGKGPHLVTMTDSPQLVGDEPLLLSQLTGVPVVVGWSRTAGLNWLAKNTDCDLVISDDGLQHSALKGDVEWCLLDGVRGIGNGYCLPAGPLREPPKRLAEVDQVLSTGALYRTAQLGLETIVPLDTIYPLVPALDLLKRVDNDQVVPWPASGSTIKAIAAIGHPQRFFADLTERGYQVDGKGFADHYQYQKNDVPTPDVVMTAKDAIKCKTMAQDLSQNWLYATQSLVLPDDLVDSMLLKLKNKLNPTLATPIKDSHG